MHISYMQIVNVMLSLFSCAGAVAGKPWILITINKVEPVMFSCYPIHHQLTIEIQSLYSDYSHQIKIVAIILAHESITYIMDADILSIFSISLTLS